jgi:hypothetical protein
MSSGTFNSETNTFIPAIPLEPTPLPPVLDMSSACGRAEVAKANAPVIPATSEVII